MLSQSSEQNICSLTDTFDKVIHLENINKKTMLSMQLHPKLKHIDRDPMIIPPFVLPPPAIDISMSIIEQHTDKKYRPIEPLPKRLPIGHLESLQKIAQQRFVYVSAGIYPRPAPWNISSVETNRSNMMRHCPLTSSINLPLVATKRPREE